MARQGLFGYGYQYLFATYDSFRVLEKWSPRRGNSQEPEEDAGLPKYERDLGES
jgi:hypothetical protein